LPEPIPAKKEQSNTSVVYGDRFILKMFRRLQDGVNPELEIGSFITERTSFEHVPKLAGSFQWRRDSRSATLGVLQSWIRNEGDAWRYTLDHLGTFYEHCLTLGETPASFARPAGHASEFIDRELPLAAGELIGSYLASARLLGQRSGELHVALASDHADPDFAPESFTPFYRRSAYQSMRTAADRTLALLRDRLKTLPDDIRGHAEKILALKSDIFSRYRFVVDQKITALRIRCHGDYHLGQVLYTGKDFVITDFEGEPTHPLSERRAKRSPLRDVAGMLRSFEYAALSGLKSGDFRPEQVPALKPLAQAWVFWVSVAFLESYLEASRSGGFLPSGADELKNLIDLYLLEKAVYELSYELNNRPDWVVVPMQGIVELVQ
jgi:maltose alpha-D-glucosyltransferase/alpha-amylase